MPIETLTAAAVIIACTYCIFGLTGFGSTAIAVPLLVHFMPLKYVVSMLLLLDLLAAILVTTRARRGVRVDELGLLVPFMFVGIVLGLTLLIRLPEAPLVGTLGLFLVGYSVYGLARRGGPPHLSRAWSAPIGLTGGAFASMFGNGGIITAVYIGARIRDKDELRATAAVAVLLNAGIRVVLFGATGLLAQDGLLLSAAFMVPSVLAGLYIGNRLHAVVAAPLVVRAVYVVVAVAGVSLLVRTFVLQ